jgi:leader peptidase (prepilin peptidase)/N-methyltransferase
MTEGLTLFVILLAPAMGSFLALLAERLPQQEDVIAKSSACRSCGTDLQARDLVPLVSYLLLHGRCRHCGAVIPARLFYMEILALGAAVLACAAGGGPAVVLLSCLFLWLLLALALTDLLWLRLPDLLTAGVFALGLGLAVVTSPAPVPEALGFALLGAGLGAGSFLALRTGYRALRGREGLGLGDVKLMAGLGAFAGPLDLPLLVLMAALMALLGGLGLSLHTRGLSAAGDQERQGPLALMPLPFGTALAAAAALIWVLRAAHLLPF